MSDRETKKERESRIFVELNKNSALKFARCKMNLCNGERVHRGHRVKKMDFVIGTKEKIVITEMKTRKSNSRSSDNDDYNNNNNIKENDNDNNKNNSNNNNNDDNNNNGNYKNNRNKDKNSNNNGRKKLNLQNTVGTILW